MAQKILKKQKKQQDKLKDFVQNYKPYCIKNSESESQKSMSAMIDKMKPCNK